MCGGLSDRFLGACGGLSGAACSATLLVWCRSVAVCRAVGVSLFQVLVCAVVDCCDVWVGQWSLARAWCAALVRFSVECQALSWLCCPLQVFAGVPGRCCVVAVFSVAVSPFWCVRTRWLWVYLACPAGFWLRAQRSQASMNGPISPSRTVPVCAVSCPLRRSLTIWYGCST